MKSKAAYFDEIRIYILLVICYVTVIRINGEPLRIATQILFIIPITLQFALYKLSLQRLILVSWLLPAIFIHALIIDLFQCSPLSFNDYAMYFLKYLSLFAIIIIFFSDLTDVDLVEKTIVRFFKFYILISLFLWTISFLTPIKIGVEVNWGIPRMQGLLSEPSNMSHFLPMMFVLNFINKQWKWLFLSIICIVLTYSPTVYLCTLLTVMLWLLIKTKLITRLILLITCLISNYLIYSYGFILSDFLRSKDFIQLSRLIDGISYIFGNETISGNARAELSNLGVEFLNTYNLWWTGSGFGSSKAIADNFSETQMLFDMSNWLSLVLWFGLIPTAILISITVYAISIANPKRTITIFFLGLTVSTSLNSGGVYYQSLFFLILFLILSKNIKAPIINPKNHKIKSS